ncbi:MAG TPA: class I SAM-dependent methyltransferase [Solirubrobacteraceae bacterium]|nr:class I SAM-dependent methyltransferase [Solirubrobacteraceae bacterium]
MAINREFWRRSDLVGVYANRELRAVERVLLERYRSGLSGEVLELGCGAGGLTGALCELARHVHGIDISAAMVEHCRRSYPQAEFTTADLQDLSWVNDASCDAVVAPFNVLDVLGAEERARLLEELGRILSPRGLLVFSSHNRDFSLGRLAGALTLWVGDRHRPLLSLRGLPRRLRNRRRLRRLERTDGDTALRNDEAHDFALLHYNISRDAQARELGAHGFELLECLDLDGHTVEPGGQARRCPELHYVARRST